LTTTRISALLIDRIAIATNGHTQRVGCVHHVIQLLRLEPFGVSGDQSVGRPIASSALSNSVVHEAPHRLKRIKRRVGNVQESRLAVF
jgi:hypothetical protein